VNENETARLAGLRSALFFSRSFALIAVCLLQEPAPAIPTVPVSDRPATACFSVFPPPTRLSLLLPLYFPPLSSFILVFFPSSPSFSFSRSPLFFRLALLLFPYFPLLFFYSLLPLLTTSSRQDPAVRPCPRLPAHSRYCTPPLCLPISFSSSSLLFLPPFFLSFFLLPAAPSPVLAGLWHRWRWSGAGPRGVADACLRSQLAQSCCVSRFPRSSSLSPPPPYSSKRERLGTPARPMMCPRTPPASATHEVRPPLPAPPGANPASTVAALPCSENFPNMTSATSSGEEHRARDTLSDSVIARARLRLNVHRPDPFSLLFPPFRRNRRTRLRAHGQPSPVQRHPSCECWPIPHAIANTLLPIRSSPLSLPPPIVPFFSFPFSHSFAFSRSSFCLFFLSSSSPGDQCNDPARTDRAALRAGEARRLCSRSRSHRRSARYVRLIERCLQVLVRPNGCRSSS